MLWDWYDEDSSEDGKTRMQLKLAWAVTNMLWYTNSAVNFLLYCVSGTRFRNAFVTWITCGHVNKDPMTQGYTHSQSHSVNAANMAAPPVEMSKF
nr:hypothetical protein BaRGS_021048 [Batillaria attramentaria]